MMSIRIYITNFHVLRHRIFKVDPILHAWEFCPVHTHLFEMMCHLYFRRYKLFNYKYVHIIKPNVLHLNEDFFLSFFFSWVGLSSTHMYGRLYEPPHSVHTLTHESDLSDGSAEQSTNRTSYLLWSYLQWTFSICKA